MGITIFVASTNAGKLRDFAIAATAKDDVKEVAILALPGLSQIPPAPENETTFEGNARSKAIYYSRLVPGQMVLADDSGLEVDALHGLPGVRSARFALDAGVTLRIDESADQANNRHLLAQMAAVPMEARAAGYRCVLALARDGNCLFTAEGCLGGQILTAPVGEGGFGYDPLFLLPSLGLTMAQVDLETKHALSHRGRAFRGLLNLLHGKTL